MLLTLKIPESIEKYIKMMKNDPENSLFKKGIDFNKCSLYSDKFLWNRMRSNEILLLVILGKITPTADFKAQAEIDKLKSFKKHNSFFAHLSKKWITCHLSHHTEKIDIIIEQNFKKKSDLIYLVNIKRIKQKKRDLFGPIKFTKEEIYLLRRLVKTGFMDLALSFEWSRMYKIYNGSDRFRYFKMHEELVFRLRVVRREDENVRFNENSLIDLRSNLSLFSTNDLAGIDNLEVGGNSRSRSNSFSDSHSLIGFGGRGFDQFKFF